MRHLIALLLATSLADAGLTQTADQTQPASPTVAAFTVIYRGVRVGHQEVSLDRTADGWRVTSTGNQSSPTSFSIGSFDLNYDTGWQPRTLKIEGTVAGQLFTVTMAFTESLATGESMQGGQMAPVSHKISPRTVVLPNQFYGAYEALAAQLATARPGASFPLYVGQQRELAATFDRLSPSRVKTPDGTLDLRRCDLTFKNTGSADVAVSLWIDTAGHLARLSVPAQGLTVLREDLATVMAREENIRNPGDEDVLIPGSGFSIAGTITTPSGVTPPALAPAVVLVSSYGPTDRDETIAGVSIFGQLAGALAKAGYFVVRYDKRGVGQTGGRTEAAGIADYADDAANVVSWVRARKDIDRSRIAILGYAEGAAMALLAGERLKSEVTAIGLLAAAGRSGREIALLQQQHVLSRTNDTEEVKQAKVAMQKRIMDAAVSGKGWESVPPELRRAADTPWHRSWLTFDPAAEMQHLSQPILIVQGALDMQVFAESAPLLESYGRQRRKLPASATRSVVVPGVNHLLVAAKTGEADEYPTLESVMISPEVASAITGWLDTVLAARQKR